jgi:hypothetical protein
MHPAFRVMVRCSLAQRDFDTGIRTSGREVLSSGIYDGKVTCPLCNQSHFLQDNAFLALDEVQSDEALWRPNA